MEKLRVVLLRDMWRKRQEPQKYYETCSIKLIEWKLGEIMVKLVCLNQSVWSQDNSRQAGRITTHKEPKR